MHQRVDGLKTGFVGGFGKMRVNGRGLLKTRLIDKEFRDFYDEERQLLEISFKILNEKLVKSPKMSLRAKRSNPDVG